jgi:nucleoside-diphosphate-sugar epimerase
MKSVLVTGATGLLGSHIALNLLETGWKVRCLYRNKSKQADTLRIFEYYGEGKKTLFQQIEWVEADILDISALAASLEGMDYVVHSAAFVSFLSKEFEVMYKINVEGTANIVNLCLDKKIKKLCHISSVAAIGRSMELSNYSEETPWKDSATNTHYAKSKYQAELEVWRGTVEGLNAIIVNPSTIIGPGVWEQSSATLINRIWKGQKYYTQGINGFVDVRDVSAIAIQLLERDISSERFIASAENVSFRELFNQIADGLNKPRPSEEATEWKAKLVIAIGWLGYNLFGIKPYITAESARTAMFKSYFSNEKVKKALGYTFIPVSEAIKHTTSCFLKDKP